MNRDQELANLRGVVFYNIGRGEDSDMAKEIARGLFRLAAVRLDAPASWTWAA